MATPFSKARRPRSRARARLALPTQGSIRRAMSKGIYSAFARPLFHNLGLKFVSLVLAVGLWLAVARQPTAEVAVEVPIAFENMPGNLEISSVDIPKAQIRLRGPERAI